MGSINSDSRMKIKRNLKMHLWGTIAAVVEWLQIGKTYTGEKM